MTKQEALQYIYLLQQLATQLTNNKIYDLATEARQLAADISLVYHITDIEIQIGKIF